MPCCALDFSRPPVRIGRVFALALILPVSVFGHSLRVLPPQGGVIRPARPVLERFVAAAVERTHHIVRYDGSYVRIPYPGGDVPASTGVCTDVQVVRSLDPTFGLDNEAVKAARQWRFKPGMRLGQPVPVLVTIELTFALR